MRKNRYFSTSRSFVHCVSHFVDDGPVLEDADKRSIVGMLRRLEAFSGIRVATYCLMEDHIHLIVENPGRENLAPFDAEELTNRLPLLCDENRMRMFLLDLEVAQRNPADEKAFLERFERRRGDLSVFLKEFYQRVSLIVNRRRGRRGALWRSRYRCVLLEPAEPYLLMAAAYVDLNPVRAGFVDCPEDYPWSGYGEAHGSGRAAALARQRLCSLLRESLANEPPEGEGESPWATFLARYSLLLDPAEAGRRQQEGSSAQSVEKAPQLSLPEVLRRRVRYFSDGGVIGSAEFVEEIFEQLKSQGLMPEKRKTGARRMRGADWRGAHSLRALQLDVIGPATD